MRLLSMVILAITSGLPMPQLSDRDLVRAVLDDVNGLTQQAAAERIRAATGTDAVKQKDISRWRTEGWQRLTQPKRAALLRYLEMVGRRSGTGDRAAGERSQGSERPTDATVRGHDAGSTTAPAAGQAGRDLRQRQTEIAMLEAEAALAEARASEARARAQESRARAFAELVADANLAALYEQAVTSGVFTPEFLAAVRTAVEASGAQKERSEDE